MRWKLILLLKVKARDYCVSTESNKIGSVHMKPESTLDEITEEAEEFSSGPADGSARQCRSKLDHSRNSRLLILPKNLPVAGFEFGNST